MNDPIQNVIKALEKKMDGVDSTVAEQYCLMLLKSVDGQYDDMADHINLLKGATMFFTILGDQMEHCIDYYENLEKEKVKQEKRFMSHWFKFENTGSQIKVFRELTLMNYMQGNLKGIYDDEELLEDLRAAFNVNIDSSEEVSEWLNYHEPYYINSNALKYMPNHEQ